MFFSSFNTHQGYQRWAKEGFSLTVDVVKSCKIIDSNLRVITGCQRSLYLFYTVTYKMGQGLLYTVILIRWVKTIEEEIRLE